MTIDNLNRLVFMNDIQVELTGKEFDLLSFLAANKGKVFTKSRFIPMYGRKSMLLMIAISCRLSANYEKKSNQTRNTLLYSDCPGRWLPI